MHTAAARLPYMPANNILPRMPDTPSGLKGTYVPVRLVIECSADAVQWFAQMAEFWNAQAIEQGRKFETRAWSRKSLAEDVVARAAEGFEKKMAPVIAEFGPLPTIVLKAAKAKQEKARFRREMRDYVRRTMGLPPLKVRQKR